MAWTIDELLQVNANNPYYTPPAAESGVNFVDTGRLSQEDLLSKLAGMQSGQGLIQWDLGKVASNQNDQWNNYGYYSLDPTGLLTRADLGTLHADLGNNQPLSGYLTLPTGEKIAPTLTDSRFPGRENENTFWGAMVKNDPTLGWYGPSRVDSYGFNYGGNTYNAGNLTYDLSSDNEFMGLTGDQWKGIGAGAAMVGSVALGGYLAAPAVAGEAALSPTAYYAAMSNTPGLAGYASAAGAGTYQGLLGPMVQTTPDFMAGGATSLGTSALPGALDQGWSTTGLMGETPAGESIPWTGTYQTDPGTSLWGTAKEAYSTYNKAKSALNTANQLLGGGKATAVPTAGSTGSNAQNLAASLMQYNPTKFAGLSPYLANGGTSYSGSVPYAVAMGPASGSGEQKNTGASKSQDYITKLAQIEAMMNGQQMTNLPWEKYS